MVYSSKEKLIGNEMEEYEEIDKIRVSGMRLAEKKYRKLKMGQYDYSPEFVTAANVITLWTLVLNKLRGRKVCAKIIIRLKKRANITCNTNVTEDEAKHMLTELYVIYKLMLDKTGELRDANLV